MKANLQPLLAKAEGLISQCPNCKRVKVQLAKGRIGFQESIFDLPALPREQCFICQTGDK